MQAQFDPDSAAAWQIRLFKKSLTKQVQLHNLQRFLSPTEHKTCLDIGGGNGILPFMLRRNGGQWVSLESHPPAVAAMKELFGEDAAHAIVGSELPFEDNCFDTIVIIDHLEEFKDDAMLLKECHRCLHDKGELLIHVPYHKAFSLSRILRKILKLDGDEDPRIREDYRLKDLYEITKNGYDMVEKQTYSGFFVESGDTWLQFFSGNHRRGHDDIQTGSQQNADQQLLRKFAKTYRIYSLFYPFMKIGQGLDKLLAFTSNHQLVIKARPRPWIERKSVHMRDGRSIADATINTRIGSAADLTDPKNNRSST
ncbi:class I SAM-dependent methyltransferase [Kiritimatiellota bacterium B12222]|nr:class I SAM-dependent methyltransferase [Kiritimatiellota bacterium B12222]